MTEQITVAFHGAGSGVDNLTWSQRALWQAMRDSGHTLAIGGVMPLPGSTTVDEALTVLRYVMGRHQSLRTRLRIEDTGEPAQVLVESGEAVLEIVDADDEAGCDQVADALRARYEDTNFDCENEWPLRMGVVRCRGRLTHAVAVYLHLAIDGPGIEALTADLAHLDRATGRETTAVAGLRPLELVRQQRTPTAQRQSQAALRHWERQLYAIPPVRPDETKRGPRYWHLDCHSPAMYLAVRSVAARTGVESGHVLLAAYARLLARITATSPSFAQVLVNNRFRPGCAESVSHLTQTGLVVIDTADSSFDELVVRSWKAYLAASKYGYYDDSRRQEIFDRVCRERGVELDLPCFYNDRRTASRRATAGPAPTAARLTAALASTTLRLADQRDHFGGLFFLHINEASEAINLTAWANVDSLSQADAEAQIRRFEQDLVEAALNPRGA